MQKKTYIGKEFSISPADSTISFSDKKITISSGNFYFYNNGTALKTDTSKDSPKEKHGIALYGGVIHSEGNEVLHSTDNKAFLLRGAKIIGE